MTLPVPNPPTRPGLRCPDCGGATTREPSQVGWLDVCPKCHRGWHIKGEHTVCSTIPGRIWPAAPPPSAVPVLGVDPGRKNGWAWLEAGRIRMTGKLDMTRPLDRILVAVPGRNPGVIVLEGLGKVGGEAAGRYSSWYSLGQTSGILRALIVAKYGLEPVRPSAHEWRAGLGLPLGLTDDEAKEVATAWFGVTGTAHVAEACLMAAFGSVGEVAR